VAFAEWLSATSSRRFRLPTEAEWEYAARSGTNTAWFWGERNEDAFNYANLKDAPGTGLRGDGYVVTAPVASLAPNPFGLSEMLGNASEWVEDPYVQGSGRYDGESHNPRVRTLSTMRVRRGGSFDDPLGIVRSTSRDFYAADLAVPQTGFRLVMEQ
jgi:formylglycine-generating enzyme required for sulfatase activity